LVLVLPGALVILGPANWVTAVPQQAVVPGARAAFAPSAVGLLIGAIWHLAPSALGSRFRVGAAVGVFVAVAFFGLPTPVAIAVAVALLWGRWAHAPSA
jgi:chromate transport protein ChrA